MLRVLSAAASARGVHRQPRVVRPCTSRFPYRYSRCSRRQSSQCTREPGPSRLSTVASTYLVLLAALAADWGIWHLASSWSQLEHGLLLREFLLAIGLTPVARSTVYLRSIWAAYETAFIRMNFVNHGPLFWAEARPGPAQRSTAWQPPAATRRRRSTTWSDIRISRGVASGRSDPARADQRDRRRGRLNLPGQ